jgi:hypothetical protein
MAMHQRPLILERKMETRAPFLVGLGATPSLVGLGATRFPRAISHVMSPHLRLSETFKGWMDEKEETLAKMEERRHREKEDTYASFFTSQRGKLRLTKEMQRQRPWRPSPRY